MDWISTHSHSISHTHTHTHSLQQAAIDLDQAEMELLLAEGNFGAAQSLYENGANSKSVANLALSSPLPTTIPGGTTVTGVTTAGSTPVVSGKVFTDASAGSTSLQVQYTTSDSPSNHVGCRVGASSTPVTDGCFAANGSADVNGVAYEYSYTIATDNFNARTIQGFATNTNKHRVFGKAENDFYIDFQHFQDYYGATDYADRLVTAALTGTNAGLSRGNQDYRNLEDVARVGTYHHRIVLQEQKRLYRKDNSTDSLSHTQQHHILHSFIHSFIHTQRAPRKDRRI